MILKCKLIFEAKLDDKWILTSHSLYTHQHLKEKNEFLVSLCIVGVRIYALKMADTDDYLIIKGKSNTPEYALSKWIFVTG